MKYLIGGLCVVAVASLGFAYFNQGGNLGQVVQLNQYRTGVTHSTVNIAQAPLSGVALSNLILAANINRIYARCQNINTNGVPVSFMEGSTATSTQLQGWVVNPNASNTPTSVYVVDTTHAYLGAVYAYAQATSTVICIEK